MWWDSSSFDAIVPAVCCVSGPSAVGLVIVFPRTEREREAIASGDNRLFVLEDREETGALYLLVSTLSELALLLSITSDIEGATRDEAGVELSSESERTGRRDDLRKTDMAGGSVTCAEAVGVRADDARACVCVGWQDAGLVPWPAPGRWVELNACVRLKGTMGRAGSDKPRNKNAARRSFCSLFGRCDMQPVGHWRQLE